MSQELHPVCRSCISQHQTLPMPRQAALKQNATGEVRFKVLPPGNKRARAGGGSTTSWHINISWQQHSQSSPISPTTTESLRPSLPHTRWKF
jgi:hypothetical protein